MKDHRTADADSVNALLAERVRYQEWLRNLERQRGATPAHIYMRVHADYTGRLARVQEQLEQQRSGVEDLMKELLDRLTTLDIQEARHRDERAEAELRGMIGEYNEEQCAAILRRCDDEMARMAEEKTSLGTELARLRAILDGTEPAQPEHHERAAERAAEPGEPQPGAERPAVPQEEERAEWLRPKSDGGTFDELEFLKGLVESSLPAQPPNAGHAAAADADQTSALPLEHPPPQPTVEEVSSDVASSLRSASPEQVKTLKCQECGTMNYPTEWYCERCGAELAAM